MSLGIISQAKGSSYVELGNTKVCCGVYGPKDVQRGNDFKMSCQVGECALGFCFHFTFFLFGSYFGHTILLPLGNIFHN